MNTENEKNISLILKQDNDDEEKLVISFGTIFNQIKRILSLWLVVAVICGLLVSAVSMFMSKTTQSDTVTSLVSFNYKGAEQGLDPNGNKFDVNKIKAPSVIETALSNLDHPLTEVESVRRNIKIQGVIPSEAWDKISLYHDIYTTGGAAGLEAVNSLLKIGYNPTYYIISIDNISAGFDIETGKKIIDEVLMAYQDYFFNLYGYNEALGNSVAAIDYKEYDYPAAVDIFKNIYDELDNYVRRVQQSQSVSFRSNITGYSFEDIRRDIAILRAADLDALSSYITINNITNDKDRLITYYDYKIEELEREKKVLEAELKSISDSIDSYEKDKLLIFGEAADMDTTEYSQASEMYDKLIENKIAVQEKYAAKKQDIEYNKSRLKAFKDNTNKNNADIEYVEESFEKLYEKTKNLIDITTKTSDEYYETIVFANAFNILVPSSGTSGEVQVNSVIIPVLIAEVVIFVVFLGYAGVSAVVMDNKKSKKCKNDEKTD